MFETLPRHSPMPDYDDLFRHANSQAEPPGDRACRPRFAYFLAIAGRYPAPMMGSGPDSSATASGGDPQRLRRSVTTGQAVLVGLTAMIGAGLFSVFTPAAAAAGSALLIGLAIAALLALCNATASAQLAISHPSAGGTYTFARQVIGPGWGFSAGWAFVLGKIASSAAMAMTFAAYALPNSGASWQRLAAAAAVIGLTAACCLAVVRSVRLAALLLTLVLICLSIAAIGALSAGDRAEVALAPNFGPLGVLQSAGLLFFAFAGYARITTLAEEVERPEQLGRAIISSLAITAGVYALTAIGLLLTLGSQLPERTDALAAAVSAAGAGWAVPLVRIAAASACLGALLALLAAISRTVLAMAREGDLGHSLATLDPVRQVPVRAQLAVGAVVLLLVGASDIRTSIGFSSFCVLLYYAITNLAALCQPALQRRWPRWLHLLGLLGCIAIALSLPSTSVLLGGLLVCLGIGAWLIRRKLIGQDDR